MSANGKIEVSHSVTAIGRHRPLNNGPAPCRKVAVQRDGLTRKRPQPELPPPWNGLLLSNQSADQDRCQLSRTERTCSSTWRRASCRSHPSAGEQLIVGCLDVTDMRNDSQAYRFFVEGLRRGRAAHPPAVLEAGVLGDGALRIAGAVREQFAYPSCETLDILPVEVSTPRLLAAASARTGYRDGLEDSGGVRPGCPNPQTRDPERLRGHPGRRCGAARAFQTRPRADARPGRLGGRTRSAPGRAQSRSQ